MAYGYIQTASNVARQLKELNRDYQGRRTWDKLYANIDLQKREALSDLTYDYDTQIAKAYSTAFANKTAIANSALGSGYKQQAEKDIDLALQEAFASYKQNFNSAASAVETSANTAIANLDNALLQESQNYKNYQDSTYSYLQYLYDRAFPGVDADYEADENLTNMFNTDLNWSKFIVKEKEGTDEETSRLMTKQELLARNYELDEQGQGTITKAGVDFYDQMLNGLSQEGSNYGFHAWLAETNPELYEWSQAGNPYDYNDAGTNMGTFKKMVGLESTDDQYKFIERFGGFTEEEITSQVQSFVSDIADVVNSGEHKDTKTLLSSYSSALDNLVNYVDKLNLGDDEKSEISNAITNLQNIIANADVKDTSDFQAWSEVVEQVKEDWAGVEREWNSGNVAAAGMELGTLGLNAILSFGTGLITGLGHFLFPKTTKALKDATGRNTYRDRATERVTSNKELVSNIEQQYLDLMTLLASYAK